MNNKTRAENEGFQQIKNEAELACKRLDEGSTAEVQFDKDQAFMLYACFMGDVEKTAHAVGVTPVDILRAADEENWLEKIKPFIGMAKTARPGDVERSISRAMNFVQAHRMRLFVGRLQNRLIAMSDEELDSYLLVEETTKSGKITRHISTRPIADLTTAMEKAQLMTYFALCDTATDRRERKDDGPKEHSAGEMHAKIAEALAKVRASASPRAQLLDAQLETAHALQQEFHRTRGTKAPPKPINESKAGGAGGSEPES